MKKLNYWIAVVLVLAAIFATIWVGGNYFYSFLDGVSLLVIVLFAFPMLIATFGWKEFRSSFALAFSRERGEPSDYARAAEVVKSTGRMIYLGAALATFIGFIAIFSYHSSETTELMANYSVALLGIFYGLIINLILIEPLKAYLLFRSKE